MTMLATPIAAPVLSVSGVPSESSSSATESAAPDCLLRTPSLFDANIGFSCSRESFVIMPQQLSSSSSSPSSFSFDWSDFPVIDDNNAHNEDFLPSQPQPEPCHQSAVECIVTPSVALSSPPCAKVFQQPVAAAIVTSSTADKKIEKDKLRRVRFSSSLEVRQLPVQLGDHPFCVGGMALTVGWADELDDAEVVDFEAYERRSLKRRMAELRLDFYARRERLLRETGLTVWELLQQEYEMQYPESQGDRQECLFYSMTDSKLSLRKHNRQRQRPTMRHAKSVDRSLMDLAAAAQAAQ